MPSHGKSLFFCLLLAFKALAQQAFYPLCNNTNFEQTTAGSYTAANAVTGWSVSSSTVSCGAYFYTTGAGWVPGSSEFSIVSTPFIGFPVIGTVLNSPLGGNKVARLNNTTPNTYQTRLAVTLTVTSSNDGFIFAFAGYYEDPGHSCCDQPGLYVRVLNNMGQQDYCKSVVLSPGCPSVNATFSTSPNGSYSNWQVRYIDLTSYIGSVVTIEFITRDCSFGGHYGTTLIDASCINSFVRVCGWGWPDSCIGSPAFFCNSSSMASIYGPVGYVNYNWTAPPGTSYSLTPNGISISNPVPYSTYTVTATGYNNCPVTYTYLLAPGSLSLCSIQSSPSCSLGSVGSATAYALGSASGYNYLWTNSSNSVVGTGSVATNLAPGVYNLTVSAIGSTYCGNVTGTVLVQTGSVVPVTQLAKPYCGGSAFFNMSAGSNFQWYLGNTPVAGSAGTQSSFTHTAPINGGFVTLGYSLQGCRDSIVYMTYSVFPGAVSTQTINLVCQGASNASAVVTFTPSNYPLTGPYSLNVTSTGSAAPYSYTTALSGASTFTISNMQAGGIYSITAFDGACYSSSTLGILPYAFNYTLSASALSLCPGTQTVVLCNVTNSLSGSACTYTWLPNLFFPANSNTTSAVIISPTIAPGTATIITYSVVVSPTFVSCPLTKTVNASIFHPFQPTVAAVNQVLCRNAPNYTLSYLSSNGNFFSPPGQFPVGTGGVINPMLSSYGVNTFTLLSSLGSCAYNTAGSYTVNGPLLSVSGATTLCSGSSATLQASGASTYTWNTGSNSPNVSVSPVTSIVYTVSGSLPGDPCVSSKTVAVNVVQFPTLTVIGPASVCAGNQLLLQAQGANSFTWCSGALTYSTLVAPVATSIYSLSASLQGALCVSTKTLAIIVHANPTVNVSGVPDLVCQGDLLTLSASGAISYTWLPFQVYSSSLSLSPLSNLSFTVKGSSGQGCKSSSTLTIITDACLGVEDLSDMRTSPVIYPQPCSEFCFVKIGKLKGSQIQQLAKLEFFDLQGRLCLIKQVTLDTSYLKIELHDLVTGVYTLRLTTLSEQVQNTIVTKVVILR